MVDMSTGVASHHARRMLYRTGATVTIAKVTKATTVDPTTLQPGESLTVVSDSIPAHIRPAAAETPTDRRTSAERDTATRTMIVRVETATPVQVGYRCTIDDHPDIALTGTVGTVVGVNAGNTFTRTLTVQLEGAT